MKKYYKILLPAEADALRKNQIVSNWMRAKLGIHANKYSIQIIHNVAYITL